MGTVLEMALPPLENVLAEATFCTISWMGRGTAAIVFERVVGTPSPEGEHSTEEALVIDAATRSQRRQLVARLVAAGWYRIGGDHQTRTIYARPDFWGPKLVKP